MATASHDEPTAPRAPARDSPPPARTGPPAGSVQNLAMRVAYDGSGYQGWQVQPHGPSIQGRLEEALRTLTHRQVKVYGSGRTDAGVHALGQVANFRMPCPPGKGPDAIDLHKLRGNLNGLAGPEIGVRAVVAVPEDFHARHSARGKVYRYQVFNRPYPPVFGRHRAWWVRQPLDVDAMRRAAGPLLGEHDFSAFRAAQCAARSPVRTLRRLEVTAPDGPECTLDIELDATGFLQHMARILAGTLVEVGLGRLAPEAVGALLEGRRREDAPATAPPGGLHLVRVEYDLAAFPTLRAFEHA